MQRISSWFEQLPLRRRSSGRRTEQQRQKPPVSRRQQCQSAAPRLRYSVSAAQNHRHREHSVDALPYSLVRTDQSHERMLPPSWNRQESVISHPCSNIAHHLTASLSQSFSTGYGSCRNNIRTNPWVSRDRPSLHSVTYVQKPSSNELLHTSMNLSMSLRGKSLDESTCSSGYGSQDSSPESSVHSPGWQSTCRLEDKAIECRSIDVDEALGISSIGRHNNDDDDDDDDDNDDEIIDFDVDDEIGESKNCKYMGDCIDPNDEHIYHELEAFSRLSMVLNREEQCSLKLDFSSSSSGSSSAGSVGNRSISRSSNSTSDSNSSKMRYLDARRHSSSPVYAQPFASTRPILYNSYDLDDPDQQDPELESEQVSEYPNTASSFTYIPCADYRPAPHFYAPPPPPAPSPPPPPAPTAPALTTTQAPNDFEKAELDFLAELDAQIAELQLKSVAVRQLVDEARERRDTRAHNAQLYTELDQLRRMKWVLRNHFELVL